MVCICLCIPAIAPRHFVSCFITNCICFLRVCMCVNCFPCNVCGRSNHMHQVASSEVDNIDCSGINLSDLLTVMLQCAALSQGDYGDTSSSWAVCCSPDPQTEILSHDACLPLVCLLFHSYVCTGPSTTRLLYHVVVTSHSFAPTLLLCLFLPLPLLLLLLPLLSPDLPWWALAGSRRWQLY